MSGVSKSWSMLKTALYSVAIVVLSIVFGYLWGIPNDQLASLQQPRSVDMHLDSVSIDMPEIYMQMSVDKKYPDTLIGWYDLDKNTVHLKFTVCNNLAAFLADDEDTDTSQYYQDTCSETNITNEKRNGSPITGDTMN